MKKLKHIISFADITFYIILLLNCYYISIIAKKIESGKDFGPDKNKKYYMIIYLNDNQRKS